MDAVEAVRREIHIQTMADGHERLVLVMLDGSTSIIERGGIGEVKFSEFQAQLYRDGKVKGVIHTHSAISKGGTFSPEDLIHIFVMDRLQFIEVIRSDGYVDRVDKPDNWNHDLLVRAFPHPDSVVFLFDLFVRSVSDLQRAVERVCHIAGVQFSSRPLYDLTAE